jgi:hypothetical protein
MSKAVEQIGVTVAAVAVDIVVTLVLTPFIGLPAAAAIGSLAASGVMALGDWLIATAQKRTFSVRDPIASHKLIYGQMKVGGAVTFIDTTSDNKSLFLVITLAGHPVESIDALYVNDTYVPLTSAGWAEKPIDWPDGTAPTNYTNYLQAYMGLGTVAGDAGLITALQAQSPKWGPNFFQYSRAKIYVRLGWNDNLFGSTGVPNIACVVSGRRVLDPRNNAILISGSTTDGTFTTYAPHPLVAGDMVFIRDHSGAKPAKPQPFWPQAQQNTVAQEYEVANVGTDTFQLYDIGHNILTLAVGGSGGTVTKMTWSDNSVLVANDYLVEPVHGMGVVFDTEVDLGLMVAGANLCDEISPRVIPSTTCTVNPADSQITYVENQAAGAVPALCQVMFTTTGTMPSGMTANFPYFWAQIGGGPTGGLSLSSVDAAKQPPACITIGSAGTGIVTMTIVEGLTPDFTTSQLNVYNNALRITTGTEVTLSNSGGALPLGLSAGVSYYAIFISDTVIKVATTLENAREHNAVGFSNNGSGNSFVAVEAEPRYTCNGVVDTSESRQSVIQKMLTSMGGYLVPSGILLNVYPAQYLTPTVTLDEGDLRGPIKVVALQSGDASFNSVKGTFVDPFNRGQPTDYPQLQNTTYIEQDQFEVVWRDLTLAFTNSSSMAQRLAKIELERIRRELTLSMALKLTAFQVGSPDTILVNNAMWGWVGESFEVQSWQFSINNQKENQTLDVDITARQTDPAVYAYTAAEEAAAKRQSNTNLPNPFVVAPPSSLTLQSGGSLIVQQPDGTLVSRIEVSWESPVDEFVLDGGFIEITYQVSGSNNWQSASTVPGDQTIGYIENATIGGSYDVAIRSRNAIGSVSDITGVHPWQAEVDSYTVLGKTNAPSNIASIAVSENGMTVNLQGSPITDTDLVCYEYRYNASNSWSGATVIGQAAAIPNGSGGFAGAYTTNKVPAGTFYFLVKALNSSGVYSAAAASAQSTVTGDISGADIAPGTLDDGAFAAGIAPIFQYSSLPSSGAYVGQVVVLTTTGVLYRWDGTQWSLEVPAVAITGQLTDAQLSAIAAAKVTGQLTAAQIASITAAQLTGQIVTTQISNSSITTPLLSAGAVDSAAIAAGTIVAGNIASSTITGTQIASATITGGNIVAGTILAGNIAAATITATQIAAATILGTNIAAATLTSGLIAANAIIAGAIAVGAVNAGNIIVNNIIVTGHIVANSITVPNEVQGSTTTLTTSFANIATITVTTSGGDVMVDFYSFATWSGSGTGPEVNYQVTRDGNVLFPMEGGGGSSVPLAINMSGGGLDTGVSAGSHVYALQGKMIGATVTTNSNTLRVTELLR